MRWLLLFLPLIANAGIIGQDDESGMAGIAQGSTTPQQMLVGAFIYTAPANEEVFKLWVYQNNGVIGNDIEVGVYDVTGGVDNATLVASGTISGTGDTGVWVSVDITPVALTNGNDYAVAWRATGSNGTFGMVRVAGGTTSREAALLGASPLPATWDEGTPFSFTYAIYAETQSTGGGGGSATVLRRARE